MREIMTPEIARSILSHLNDLFKAALFEGSTQRPFQVQKIVIDLSTARLETSPYEINFGFKSFYVADATDVNVSVNIRPTSNDTSQSFFAVKKNDSWDAGLPISKAYLHWDAQSGKSITLVFFTDSSFRSGSQISVTGGGVSIVDGSTFSQSLLTFTAATALQIFASDSTRKNGTFQNNTGASVWVGSSSVTNTKAFLEVPDGSTLNWRNTAALYGYSVPGGTAHKTEEF